MELLWLLGAGLLALVLVVRDWRREQWVRALRRLTPMAVPASDLAVSEVVDAGD